MRVLVPLVLALGLAAPAAAQTLPRQPQKPVDLNSYLGRWYEQGRYEQRFQKGCEGVTADYSLNNDGTIKVLNTCHEGAPNGPVRTAEAKAAVTDKTTNAKLKVTFFWPFSGDYWVLDHADDYSWAIVGEDSGDYLWLLTRARTVSPARYADLTARAARFGYDTSRIRRTQQ